MIKFNKILEVVKRTKDANCTHLHDLSDDQKDQLFALHKDCDLSIRSVREFEIAQKHVKYSDIKFTYFTCEYLYVCNDLNDLIENLKCYEYALDPLEIYNKFPMFMHLLTALQIEFLINTTDYCGEARGCCYVDPNNLTISSDKMRRLAENRAIKYDPSIPECEYTPIEFISFTHLNSDLKNKYNEWALDEAPYMVEYDELNDMERLKHKLTYKHCDGIMDAATTRIRTNKSFDTEVSDYSRIDLDLGNHSDVRLLDFTRDEYVKYLRDSIQRGKYFVEMEFMDIEIATIILHDDVSELHMGVCFTDELKDYVLKNLHKVKYMSPKFIQHNVEFALKLLKLDRDRQIGVNMCDIEDKTIIGMFAPYSYSGHIDYELRYNGVISYTDANTDRAIRQDPFYIRYINLTMPSCKLAYSIDPDTIVYMPREIREIIKK